MTKQHYSDQHFVNHLANQAEKLATKGHKLKPSLHNRIIKLEALTKVARLALTSLLPDELLNELSVVHHSTYHVTLSVSDATTANHLRYLQDVCLMHLSAFDDFANVSKLKVIVTPNLIKNYLETQQLEQKKAGHQQANFKTLDEFSENSKRTITQAIENVTPQSELGMALKKLFNQE